MSYEDNIWTFVEPHHLGGHATVTISEQQILDHYWEHWYERMKKAGKENEATKEKCIEEWVVVNWAWKAESLPLEEKIRQYIVKELHYNNAGVIDPVEYIIASHRMLRHKLTNL